MIFITAKFNAEGEVDLRSNRYAGHNKQPTTNNPPPTTYNPPTYCDTANAIFVISAWFAA